MASTSENGSAPFRVRIAATGNTFDVPADKSLFYVLIDNGYRVRSLCSNGECGTCRVRYTEGVPDHRDQALGDDERSEYMTVCVSRARRARRRRGAQVAPVAPVAPVAQVAQVR